MEAFLEQTPFDDIDVRVVRSGESYVAEVQLQNGAVYTDTLPPLDWERFARIEDVREYGSELFRWLFLGQAMGNVSLFAKVGQWASKMFGEEKVSLHSALQRAQSSVYGGSAGSDRPNTRLRLWLDPAWRPLHKLWWESMFDPQGGGELALKVAMARFVRTGQHRMWPVAERPLRVLVATANPAGLERFGCQPVDASLESALLANALSPVGPAVEIRNAVRASAQTLADGIREFRPHIVYVLAHAIFDEGGEGSMLLCAANGEAEPVPFKTIVPLLVPDRSASPRLVFLALPQSSRIPADVTLATLGPEIAQAGAQSVLAVNAPLPPAALLRFSEVLFVHLLQGQPIEAATMTARNSLFKPNDWDWALPVLYLGTPDGTLFQPLPDEVETSFENVSRKLRHAS